MRLFVLRGRSVFRRAFGLLFVALTLDSIRGLGQSDPEDGCNAIQAVAFGLLEHREQGPWLRSPQPAD